MSRGATPAGVEPENEAEVAHHIRQMFGRVAPRYDLLNRLLSLRVDQYWRRYTVRSLGEYLRLPELRLMDLCCGTGDLLVALERERRRLNGGPNRPGLGSDFCRPMLAVAQQKIRRNSLVSDLIEADALQFPLADESLDLITVAYGFRNFANYRRGLTEMFRLLTPGGCLAILEFSEPVSPVWGPLFSFYFRHILPRIGNAISGSDGAYSYLQRSVQRFLTPSELADAARACGFRRIDHTPLSGGISVLYLAYK